MAKDSKMNKEGIMRLCAEIAKKEGSGIVYSLGSKTGDLAIPRWKTGLPDLDNIIGGGMPKGRNLWCRISRKNIPWLPPLFTTSNMFRYTDRRNIRQAESKGIWKQTKTNACVSCSVW